MNLDKMRNLCEVNFIKPGNKGQLNKLPIQYNPT